MKKQIIKILEKFGITEYQWKFEIADELEKLFRGKPIEDRSHEINWKDESRDYQDGYNAALQKYGLD